jgi:hypothetical protein
MARVTDRGEHMLMAATEKRWCGDSMIKSAAGVELRSLWPHTTGTVTSHAEGLSALMDTYGRNVNIHDARMRWLPSSGAMLTLIAHTYRQRAPLTGH